MDGMFLSPPVHHCLTYNRSILQGVPQKQKLQLDGVRKLADHARNYQEYRSRLRETVPPAVPFLGASFGSDSTNACNNSFTIRPVSD
jgi:hypothetical protein